MLANPSGLFRSRSLLFIFILIIRIAGILAMLMLVVAQLLNIVNNVKGYQDFDEDSKAVIVQYTALSTFDSATQSGPTPTPTPTHFAETLIETPTTASEIVQPDKSQQQAISEAAEAQRSSLMHRGSSPTSNNERKKRHIKRADDPLETSPSPFFPGTDVPQETGALAFIIIERFISIFILCFLAVSEMAPPRISCWYQRHFPPLGPDHGVGWLGILMVWIGAACLSHATSINAEAYKFQEIAAWIVFVIGLVNCLFGVFLFESIRQFRSLVPGDEPQPEFNSYSSTQGHSPPMRSMSLAKHGQDVERPQPALKEFGRSSSRNQAASANSNRRSFKGFGPRKATYHTNLGHGRNPSSPPSLGGGAASFAKQQHDRSASTGGRMFDGTAPRSFNSLREASRSASGPPGYTKHQDSHRAEILALDPATAPAIRYVRR